MTFIHSQYQAKGSILRDAEVREGSVFFFKLSPLKDKFLTTWAEALPVLYLGLNVFNSFIVLNIKGECLACKKFNDNLHLVRSWLI